jgi:signal transduction histidine kinase
METDPRKVMSLILDALPQAAMIAGRDGRIVLRNSEADAMLPGGWDAKAVLGDGQAAEVHWDTEMAALADGAGRLVRRGVHLAGKGSRQLVADIHYRNLPPLPPDFAPAPAAGPGGPYVLVLVEDVSSRLSMERRLAVEERLTATGAIAAKLAHELNNPLDGAMRFLGLAQRAPGEKAGKYLDQARNGLTRMAQIIRGLLDEGRPWQAAGERAPVRRLLDEAAGVMHPRAQSLGVSVVCDFDDRVDGTAEGCVFQVFCNVIKNALDAMPGGGVLTIRLRPAGTQCEVEFADTGCGLSDQEAERIFEPFYTTKPPSEGSGLGLTICREILARLGGTIAARGRGEGGAAFTVRLPVQAARAGSGSDPPPPGRPENQCE